MLRLAQIKRALRFESLFQTRDESSVEVREVPETEDEQRRALANYQSAGHDGARGPGK